MERTAKRWFRVLKGKRKEPRTSRENDRQRLTAALVNLYADTQMTTALFTNLSLAVNYHSGPAGDVLTRLAASAQTWGGRLLARLAATGGSPLLMPPQAEDRFPDLPRALDLAARAMAFHAAVCKDVAEHARDCQDPAAAWVLELNRAEAMDAALELGEMREKSRKWTAAKEEPSS